MLLKVYWDFKIESSGVQLLGFYNVYFNSHSDLLDYNCISYTKRLLRKRGFHKICLGYATEVCTNVTMTGIAPTMVPNITDPQKEAHTTDTRVEQLEATIAALQQAKAKLEQQVNDDAIELQATVDEYERATEEARRARAEAERANKVKTTFLASMSHELRTPLNAILNFSQFLASGMMGSVNAEQVEMLDKITFSGKHLLNLINDVLDISKIESGSLRLFVEPDIDLEEEAMAAADTGRALLKGKPVELKLDVAPDLPKITADKRRVRQILLNLVSNACKFTETGEVIISLGGKNDEALLSVKDTGPGIAPEEHELIFEAFRQSHVGIQHGSGTGLGLAISRRLAQAHGGRLWVESEAGKGATFHIALPVKPATAPKP